MARYFPIAVDVRGRHYTGDWAVMQTGRICVRSDAGYGTEMVDVGQGDPSPAAKRALQGIVTAHQEAQAAEAKRREREKLARLRKNSDA